MTDRAVQDDRIAPDAEDPRKPDSPPEVSTRSWKYIFRKTFREFVDDCQDSAAALTYYGVLEGVAPPEVLQVLSDPLQQFADSPAAGLGFVTGLVITLWSATDELPGGEQPLLETDGALRYSIVIRRIGSVHRVAASLPMRPSRSESNAPSPARRNRRRGRHRPAARRMRRCHT